MKSLDSAALEEHLARFEQAWQVRPPAPLQEFLPADTSLRRPFLLDAIPIDLEYRWCRFSAGGDFLKASDELSSHPLLDDYLRWFPDLGAKAALPASLIGEEYRVRRWAGERPKLADYLHRFPTQAATLRQTVAEIDRDLARSPPPATPQVSEASIEAPVELPLLSVGGIVSQLETLPFLNVQQRRELPALIQSAGNDPAVLMRLVVECGWLTPFQADFLGRGRGTRLIVGAYVLLERIGSGWSSQVFRALHVPLNRVVALKLFRRELLQGMDPVVLDRFYHEMQAVGRLSHPNVVHAYDAGPVAPTLFIAMEYLEGIDLQRLVERSGPLPVEQAASYIYQAALGLQHAYERGLVHRDIKPSNLFLATRTSSNGAPVVKVLDVGLARIHQAVQGGSGSALTRTGWLMGTADFMAPEQGYDPHAVDVRADLYSLGCTFFYLLAGRPPFPGGTFVQKLNRHREAEPPDLAGLRPDLPPALVTLVARLLRKRPEERWATPADFCAALAATFPPPEASAPSPRPRRRGPMLAAAIATAILMLGLCVGAFIWRGDTKSQATADSERPVTDSKRTDAGKATPRSAFPGFEGIWVIAYTNGATRIYFIDARGRVFFVDGGHLYEGQLRKNDREILLDFQGDGNRLERIQVVDGRFKVDHFNPASGYPSRPLCTGQGEKKATLPEVVPRTSGPFAAWEGIWTIRYGNGVNRVVAVDDRGFAFYADGREIRQVSIAPNASQVVLQFGGDQRERLRLQNRSLQVEQFSSATGVSARGNPVGAGVKH
jgi:serine/threonine-protein kinase